MALFSATDLAGTLADADLVVIVQNTGTFEAPVWVVKHTTIAALTEAVSDPAPIDDPSAAYAVLNADHRASRRMTSAAAKTVTVTPDSTGTAKRNGYRQDFYNWGAGDVTFVAGAGVTVQAQNGGTLVLPQYGAASLIRMAADVYLLVGSLTSSGA